MKMEQNNKWKKTRGGVNLNLLGKECVSVFLSSKWHQEWRQIYDNVFTERRCMKWKYKAVNDILMHSQGFICCSECFHTFSPIYRKRTHMEFHHSCLPLSPSAVVFTFQMIICARVPLGMFEHSSRSAIYQTCFHHLTHSRGKSWTISTRTGNPKAQKQDHIPSTTTQLSNTHHTANLQMNSERAHLWAASCRGSGECSGKLKHPPQKFPGQKQLPIIQSVSVQKMHFGCLCFKAKDDLPGLPTFALMHVPEKELCRCS